MTRLKAALLVGLFVLLSVAAAAAQTEEWSRTVTVTWSPSPESDLLEYRLYENGSMVLVVPAGTEIAERYITEPGTYSWYLTAADESLNESGPSNTVSRTLDGEAPSAPSINITITTTTTVTVTQ